MILDEIMAHKEKLRAARAPRPLEALWSEVERCVAPRPFSSVLRRPASASVRVIAEFKRRSPSAGAIRPGADPAEVTRGYEQAGAVALSILTDEPFFDGNLAHLALARGATRLPVLRKDFLLDARDLLEARLASADAALLIVRLLVDAQLKALIEVANAAGLATLVEAHTDREIDRALAAGARTIGINHRDLDTLQIDLGLSERARARVGPEVVLVGESGLRTPEDLVRMRDAGMDAVLVGEALMRAPSPGAALSELLGCG